MFAVGNDGAIYTIWIYTLGFSKQWQPQSRDDTHRDATVPLRLTPTNMFPTTAHVAAIKRNDLQLDVFAVGNDGAIYTIWVLGGGQWQPSSTTNMTDMTDPYRPYLPASLPMYDWGPWPHIHGTPVYFNFSNGRSMLYVWPEKDYLRSFVRNQNHFLESNQSAPKGPSSIPSNMPGGMLSVSVDPGTRDGGVLFASCPIDRLVDPLTGKETENLQGLLVRGLLRAFDPFSLIELWNNSEDQKLSINDNKEGYYFAKFCPPTVANGKVFLPSFSNKVLVYGKKAII